MEQRQPDAYGLFRASGYFIGSGVVEAGCKTVAGDRCKPAGMFWSQVGAENILALRCLHSSRRLDPWWKNASPRWLPLTITIRWLPNRKFVSRPGRRLATCGAATGFAAPGKGSICASWACLSNESNEGNITLAWRAGAVHCLAAAAGSLLGQLFRIAR